MGAWLWGRPAEDRQDKGHAAFARGDDGHATTTRTSPGGTAEGLRVYYR